MVTDMRQRSSHVKSTLLCALRIYFGVQLCIGALGGVALYMSFVFSSEGIDAQNAIALVIMTFGCTAGAYALLHKRKPKPIAWQSAVPDETDDESDDIFAESEDEPISFPDGSEVKSTNSAHAFSTYNAAERAHQIFDDCLDICQSTVNVDVFMRRYQLLTECAEKLLRDELLGNRKVAILKGKEAYEYALSSGNDIKARFLKRYTDRIYAQAGSLKTKNGKINKYLHGLEELESVHPFFCDTDAYDKVISRIQANVDMLQ